MATARQTANSSGWLLVIDRYMLRQFVQSFFICFISLTGLYIVLDAFNNLEEFINEGQRAGGMARALMRYYACRSLWFFDGTSNVITLIAAMFTVTWIQRHNELTALEAAGISKWRVLRPMVAAVVAISFLAAANREFLMPPLRAHLTHNAQNLGGRAGMKLLPRYDNETGILLGGSNSLTFAAEQRIHKPDFNLPSGLDRYGSQLTAEDAYYKPPTHDRPGGYLFRGIHEPAGIDRQPSLALGESMTILTPRDYPWLEPGECFVVSDLAFEHLEQATNLSQLSSTFELVRGLRNRSLDFGADERLVIHARAVQPILDMTLLFLGLPLVLSRSNRNVFLAIGLCLALVLAFMIVVFACQYLGRSYWIEPSLAAWLPLMIFVPAAIGLSQPLRE